MTFFYYAYTDTRMVTFFFMINAESNLISFLLPPSVRCGNRFPFPTWNLEIARDSERTWGKNYLRTHLRCVSSSSHLNS